MSEPTQEQIINLGKLAKKRKIWDGWTKDLDVLLAAYEERGREIERLRAENADLRKANLGLGKGLAEQNQKVLETQRYYQTLRDAVNNSGECGDPEHGEGCACHADVMLSNLQAQLARVVDYCGRMETAWSKEEEAAEAAFDVKRGYVAERILTIVSAVRALAAQPEESKCERCGAVLHPSCQSLCVACQTRAAQSEEDTFDARLKRSWLPAQPEEKP